MNERKQRAGWKARVRWLGTLGGFVAGLVIGPYASELVVRSNPGFFGPNNQNIIEEQQENFGRLEETLAALGSARPGDAEYDGLVGKLTGLLQEQRVLAQEKDELFKATDVAGQEMKEQLLKKCGKTGSVDFWVQPGRSMVLRDPGQVFSVIRGLSGNTVRVNLNGKQSRLAVGDRLELETSGGVCEVIYRQDDRQGKGYGFDLVCR